MVGSRGSERTGTAASFRSRLLSASPGSKGGSVDLRAVRPVGLALRADCVRPVRCPRQVRQLDGCPGAQPVLVQCQIQPLSRARRSASMRFRAPVLLIAEER
jgi:hypothetical protein